MKKKKSKNTGLKVLFALAAVAILGLGASTTYFAIYYDGTAQEQVQDEGQLKKLQDQLAQAQTQRDILQNQLQIEKDNNAKLSAVGSQNNELKSQLAASDKRIEELETQIGTLDKQIENLKNQAASSGVKIRVPALDPSADIKDNYFQAFQDKLGYKGGNVESFEDGYIQNNTLYIILSGFNKKGNDEYFIFEIQNNDEGFNITAEKLLENLNAGKYNEATIYELFNKDNYSSATAYFTENENSLYTVNGAKYRLDQLYWANKINLTDGSKGTLTLNVIAKTGSHLDGQTIVYDYNQDEVDSSLKGVYGLNKLKVVI